MICAIRSITWRSSLQKHGQVAKRRLTLTCRGSPITRDEIFRYTNGNFLSNEANAFSRRYLKFDLDELCSIASRTGSISAVKEVEKMEGGFSKALLMRKVDGTEVVAKPPFKIAGPAHHTTASEVAVLQYVHQHTKVPVPKVLAWSSNPKNAVGAEYIIMEKASGVQLVKVYGNMPDYDHLMLIKNLCALESAIAAIKFPAIGSLYLRQSLQDSGDEIVPLDPSADPEGQFCVGPSCERTWHEAADCGASRGPWLDLSSWGQALVQRETFRINNASSDHQESVTPRLSTKAEQIATLKLASEVVTRFGAESLQGKFASPTLWHNDLHLGNIYVSEKDPTQIVSIIDWQSVSTLPLFCQVRTPEFLDLPEDYEIGGPVPNRPENLGEMEEDDRLLAEHEHKQVCMGRAYEAASGFKNKQVYKALRLPSCFKDFFSRIGDVAEEGPAPLRACLIELSQVWAEAGLEGMCPIEFTAEELVNHEGEFEQYEIRHRIREIARDVLDTDSEGWIAPGIDIDAKRQQKKELLQLMIEKSAEYGKSPQELQEIWPF